MAIEDQANETTAESEKLAALLLLIAADADVQDAEQIIRIDPEVISYRDSIGRLMTAWLRPAGPITRVAIEVGWNAEPSATSRRIPDPRSD